MRKPLLLILLLLGAGCSPGKGPADARPGQFKEVQKYASGKVLIKIGMTKGEVRKVIAGGRQRTHKYYAFRPPDKAMFATNVWMLTYGPERVGMGRVDRIELTFRRGRVSKIRMRSVYYP